MRAVLVLVGLNAAIWGTWLAIFLGSHFALPDSDKFWWLDDAPWAVLLVSVVVPVLLALSRVRLLGWVKWLLAGIASVTLLAFPFYAGTSGGGV